MIVLAESAEMSEEAEADLEVEAETDLQEEVEVEDGQSEQDLLQAATEMVEAEAPEEVEVEECDAGASDAPVENEAAEEGAAVEADETAAKKQAEEDAIALQKAAADHKAVAVAKRKAEVAAVKQKAEEEAALLEREQLLGRLVEIARGIADLQHLREVVKHVETLRRDYEERDCMEAESLEEAERALLARRPAVIRQLSFYFSDANLRHDKYLRDKILEDPSGEGFVPISILLPFNRLKRMGCVTESEVVAAVEAASPGSGLELGPSASCSSRGAVVRRAGDAPLPPLAGKRKQVYERQCVEAVAGEGGDALPSMASKRPRLRDASDPADVAETGAMKDSAIAGRARDAAARFERGLVLRLTGLPPEITWREVKDGLEPFGHVAYVDLAPEGDAGLRAAHVRMRNAEAVANALAAIAADSGHISIACPPTPAAPEAKASTTPVVIEDDEVKPATASIPTGSVLGITFDNPFSNGDDAAVEASSAVADPYGGEAVSAEPEAPDAEAEPFVVDTDGDLGTAGEGAESSSAAAPPAPSAAATIDLSSSEGSGAAGAAAAPKAKDSKVRIAAELLKGDAEEEYLQKSAVKIMEQKSVKKGGKLGKDGKGSKGKFAKDGKGGKAGKGKKGGKAGKGKPMQHMQFDSDSD